MRYDLIRSLHCPYTGSPLHVTAELDVRGPHVEYGVVTSEAGDFPIVGGILRLLVDESREPIVQFLKDGRIESALLAALELPFNERRDQVVNLMLGAAFRVRSNGAAHALLRLKRRLYSAITGGESSFVEMARSVHAGAWTDWNVYRFSMPTFLPVYPLTHVIPDSGPILDFGCGVAHGSFLISRMAPGSPLVCADYSFSALYMAKQYVVPEADFVCLDGDHLLPFDSDYFACIYSSDALHCIDGRLVLSQEFARSLRTKGVIVLPHLHNKRSAVSFGKSLTPEGYAGLFSTFERRVMSEREVVRDYLVNDRLDLASDRAPATIGQEQGMSLVASRDPNVFRRYLGLWDQRIAHMQNPVLNPVYEYGADGTARKRRLPPLLLPGGDLFDVPILPDQFRLQGLGEQDIFRNLRIDNPVRFRDFAKRFIVIDAPARFLGVAKAAEQRAAASG